MYKSITYITCISIVLDKMLIQLAIVAAGPWVILEFVDTCDVPADTFAKTAANLIDPFTDLHNE